MLRSRLLFAVAAAAVSFPASAAADPITSVPTAAPAFAGRTAVPQPVPAAPVPRHPFMAPNERSNLHNDGYQTDSNRRTGPLGTGITTTSGQYAGVCGSVTFDTRGRIVTVCVGVGAVTLRLLDPRTLESLSEYELPPRQTGLGNPFQNFTGGGYFYLDHEDRAVLGTSDRRLLVIGHVDGQGFRVQREVALAQSIPEDDAIISILPDWDGRYWVATRDGLVLTVGRDDDTVRVLDTGEPNGNSFAVGEDGVYIVTDAAMYRFEAAADGTPTVVWRVVYPNDGTRKPGQTQQGSGTTPTLMGPDLVAITDNADPIDVVVYRRARTVTGDRELCRVPVFARGASSSDQSLLTDGTSLVVENNHGYEGPQTVLAGATTRPGLARVDVDRSARTCTVRWTADVTAPSVVPKLALGSGLVYTYTKPGGDPTDPWFLTTLDYRTGETVYDALAGAGPLFNNNYAPVTFGPDGTAYVGVIGGLVALRDASAPSVEPSPEVAIASPLDVPAVRARRARVRIDCGRRRTIVVRTTDSRARLLTVDRAGRTARDGRRPLRLRVRAGAPLTVRVRLADGASRTVRVAAGRCRR